MGRGMAGRYGAHPMGGFCIGGLCSEGLETPWACLLQSTRGAWKEVGRFSGVSGLDPSVGLCPMKSRLCPRGSCSILNSSYSICGSLMPSGRHPLVAVTSLSVPTDQTPGPPQLLGLEKLSMAVVTWSMGVTWARVTSNVSSVPP